MALVDADKDDDKRIEKLVQSTISSLGYLEKEVYYKEPDCFESIRDLIRLLHNDKSESLLVRRICLSQNIIKNDLVPIMKSKDTTDELFDAALRLTVNLSQPTIIALNGKLPENNIGWTIFYNAERSLAKCIAAFTDSVIFDVLSKKCQDYFFLEWEDRVEKQKLLIERIFVLIRYIFSIGTESNRYIKIVELEGPMKGKLLLSFLKSPFVSLFFKILNNPMEREFGLHILSIFSLAFKNIDVNFLIMKECDLIQKKKEETEKELSIFFDIKKRDEQVLKFNRKRTFLKGTFVVKGVKALASVNDLVVQKCGAVNTDKESPIVKLTKRKAKRRLPQNRRVADLDEVNLNENNEVNGEILTSVRDFCLKLLNEDIYNKLTRMTRDIAFASGRSLTHKYSEIYYFSFASFIMRFSKVAKVLISKIVSTFSIDFFHHIISYVEINFEGIKVDKENIHNHALKLQYAFEVYKEMLIILNLTMSSENEWEKEYCKDLCDYIFQKEEYRSLGFSIMNTLKPASTTRKMLQDLVMANHYYIHIMEKVSKAGNLVKVIKKKKKTQRQKKANKKIKEDNNEINQIVQLPKEELNKLWNNTIEEISDALTGKVIINEDISPINILLKVEDEEHQKFALFQIQTALREHRICDGIGIYRAARSLWPETGTFGDDSLSIEEELNEINELFFSDLSEIGLEYNKCMKETYGHDSNLNIINEDVTDVFSENEDENKVDEEYDSDQKDYKDLDKKAKYSITEKPFDFSAYVINFSKPLVLYWYIFLLKNFEKNSLELNKALLKIMHRLAFDLKFPDKLYLASLFLIFKRVNFLLSKCTTEEIKNHKFYELYIFGYHLIRKFLDDYKEQGSILVCELLLG